VRESAWAQLADKGCVKTLDSSGMLLDFTILKKYLKDILELLDHRNLNDIPPFDKLNPSAENLAFYIFSTLKNKLSDNHSQAKVYRIDVYESFKSFASYTEDAIGVNNV
jgi:6-pyruvoyltetrahydropterin/6-carboxytetrahydropterin synthase